MVLMKTPRDDEGRPLPAMLEGSMPGSDVRSWSQVTLYSIMRCKKSTVLLVSSCTVPSGGRVD